MFPTRSSLSCSFSSFGCKERCQHRLVDRRRGSILTSGYSPSRNRWYLLPFSYLLPPDQDRRSSEPKRYRRQLLVIKDTGCQGRGVALAITDVSCSAHKRVGVATDDPSPKAESLSVPASYAFKTHQQRFIPPDTGVRAGDRHRARWREPHPPRPLSAARLERLGLQSAPLSSRSAVPDSKAAARPEPKLAPESSSPAGPPSMTKRPRRHPALEASRYPYLCRRKPSWCLSSLKVVFGGRKVQVATE